MTQVTKAALLARVEALEKALADSLEQQTATSEILRTISRSPTELGPVLDAVAENAARLCEAGDIGVFQLDGDILRAGARYGTGPKQDIGSIVRIRRDLLLGRTLLERHTIHVHDMAAELETEYLGMRSTVERFGMRTMLCTPLLSGGKAVGVIVAVRYEVRPFSDKHIQLLETFADQAVIAIENVRLFKELQEKNYALTEAHAQVSEALEQQTATSDILRVISSSPTDLQPVMAAVAENAARLCNANDAQIFRADGDILLRVGSFGSMLVADQFPLGRGNPPGRAIVDRQVIHVNDIAAEVDTEFPDTRHVQKRQGIRTVLAAPLLREGVPVGAIVIRRLEVQPFSDKQVALLHTFADQAVIAIENVRLFTELETSNRELTTALDTQTATSDILRFISRSQADVQPVFDAIVASASRLCDAEYSAVARFEGGLLHLTAVSNMSPEATTAWQSLFPRSPGRHFIMGRAFVEGRPIHVEDIYADPEWDEGTRRVFERVMPYRTFLGVPILRDGVSIGVIGCGRRGVKPFAATQIELVKTFADQAVIAIENARLLSELQARTEELTRSVGELRGLSDVSQALSATLDIDLVLDTIVARANDLIGADGCTIFEYDEGAEQFHLRTTRNLEPRLVELARGTPLRKGDEGILGRLAVERQPGQVADITIGSYSSPLRDALVEAGYRAVVAVPLVREGHLIGALTLNRKAPGAFPRETIELLQTFATQSALAIQNARLFREIEIKSRELEVASQHKSEFLASMSHELRTPLNAIIGFSDVLLQGMFGEMTEKQTEYLQDILASGQHLLSLINDILDLSKIEAGRMELDVAAFDLPTAIDDALLLMRERAGRRGITLERHVDERLGEIRADQRKVKQVLLNLLSNAVKFTPEGGRIDVRAGLADGTAEISVTDTGIGIAPEDHDAVFEEFRQVGKADKKAEGTGLGLALCRKFVELHGGRIWVKSQVGQGSTFTFTLPVRRED